MRTILIALLMTLATQLSAWELGNQKIRFSIEGKPYNIKLPDYFCELKSGKFFEEEVLGYAKDLQNNIKGFVPCFVNQMSFDSLYQWEETIGPMPVGRVSFKRYADDRQVNSKIVFNIINNLAQNYNNWDGTVDQIIENKELFLVRLEPPTFTVVSGSKLTKYPDGFSIFLLKSFYVGGLQIEVSLTAVGGLTLDKDLIHYLIKSFEELELASAL